MINNLLLFSGYVFHNGNQGIQLLTNDRWP